MATVVSHPNADGLAAHAEGHDRATGASLRPGDVERLREALGFAS